MSNRGLPAVIIIVIDMKKFVTRLLQLRTNTSATYVQDFLKGDQKQYLVKSKGQKPHCKITCSFSLSLVVQLLFE